MYYVFLDVQTRHELRHEHAANTAQRLRAVCAQVAEYFANISFLHTRGDLPSTLSRVLSRCLYAYLHYKRT